MSTSTKSLYNNKLEMMKIINYLACLLLLVITSGTSHLLPDTLLLSESLYPFQNCTLTLLTTKLEKGYRPRRGIHDLFYEIEPHFNHGTIRFLLEHKQGMMGPSFNGAQCDDHWPYVVNTQILPKVLNPATTNYPLDRRGCDVIVYISPIHCKKTWKIQKFASTKLDYVIPDDFIGLLKGIGFRTFMDTEMERSDFFGLSTTFPKYVIVVQKEQMEFPLSLYFAFDYNTNIGNHPIENQAFKILIQISRRSKTSNLLEVRSVVAIYDWQSENFKKQSNFGCDLLKPIVSTLSNIHCVICNSNSCGCLINFSVHQNLKEVLRNLNKIISRLEKISWSIIGTEPCSSSNQEKCLESDSNIMYLTNWKKEYVVDNIILLQIFPNSTLYKEEYSLLSTNYKSLPYIRMRTFESSEYFYGFRKNSHGNRYVTCANGLGLKWFVSLTGFFSIFDLVTWSILLFCVCSAGSLFTALVASKKSFSDYIWHTMFSFVILLEQGLTLPKSLSLSKRVGGSNNLLPIYCSWIIASIVLSNGYRGANIEKLIAPIPETKFETFDQIIKNNFTVFVKFSDQDIKSFKEYQNEIYSGVKSANLSLAEMEMVEKNIKSEYDLFVDHYFHQLSSGFILSSMNILKMERGLLVLILNRELEKIEGYFPNKKTDVTSKYEKIVDFILLNIKIPSSLRDMLDSSNDSVIVEQLSKCKNEAFLGGFETVNSLASTLRKKLKLGTDYSYDHVSISKESLMPAYKTKVFYNIPANMRQNFKRRILSLSESGLENLWYGWAEYWNRWNDTWDRKRSEVPVRSVSLYDSNVRVVFLLLLTVVAIPILVFLAEASSLVDYSKIWTCKKLGLNMCRKYLR